MAKRVIKSVGVLSLAKVYAVVMGAMGLVFGVIYGLIMLVGGALMTGSSGGGGVMAGGLLFAVLVPIFYAAFGFIGGAITALIYNSATSFVGGLEFEVEDVTPPSDSFYQTPPAPFIPNDYQTPSSSTTRPNV